MNKKLLLTSLIICFISINMLSAQNEQDLLEKYKAEFIKRALSPSNRKIVKGISDLGEKVNYITYDQVQTSNSNIANIKEIVLTKNNDRITDLTFRYGSEPFLDGVDYSHSRWVKGMSVFRLVSRNILNEYGKTIFLKNSYEVLVINSHDKKVSDVYLKADLHISAAVYENLELITKKYNEAYKTRSIKELKDLGLHLTTNENGYDETNKILLKMILKEREAIINNILREYDSYFTINFDVMFTKPEQIWDQFYIDPINFITTVCKNSPLLKKNEQENVVLKQIKIGDNHAGGIVFMVDASGKHGLVCAPKDQGVLKWDKAKKICLDLNLNGYSDWYLPSESELKLMREKIGQGNDLGLDNIGGFNNYGYWSSTKGNSYAQEEAKGLSFRSGNQFEKGINTYSHARAIRAF